MLFRSLSLIDTLVASGTDAIVECFANYLEIAHNCFVRRNHPDLELLRPKLEQTLRRFLIDKCVDEGDLAPCLEQPAADAEGYFPAGVLPPEPATPSGNAHLDAYRLNVLVHDEDEPLVVLSKLITFVKTDPMLWPEFTVEMVSRLAARSLHFSKAGDRKSVV